MSADCPTGETGDRRKPVAVFLLLNFSELQGMILMSRSISFFATLKVVISGFYTSVSMCVPQVSS